jgi:hypothetical protein
MLNVVCQWDTSVRRLVEAIEVRAGPPRKHLVRDGVAPSITVDVYDVPRRRGPGRAGTQGIRAVGRYELEGGRRDRVKYGVRTVSVPGLWVRD